jgi:AcrR family transcriptional regulator
MNSRSSRASAVSPLRERIRQATVRAILDAAEETFAAEGLHSARMNDIAARAGVAVGTLYNHFKDREALLEGLLAVRRQELLSHVDAASDGPGEFRERLTRMMRGVFDYFAAHRRFFQVYMQDELAQRRAGHARPELARDLYARLEKLVRLGLREKALRREDAELYPAMLLGVLKGVLLRDEYGRGPAQPVEASVVVRCFLEGAGT